MLPAESPRPGGGWTLGEGVCWLLLLPVLLLLVARPARLAAFPTSLSDCQTPTGWNCSGESRPGPNPAPAGARASPPGPAPPGARPAPPPAPGPEPRAPEPPALRRRGPGSCSRPRAGRGREGVRGRGGRRCGDLRILAPECGREALEGD